MPQRPRAAALFFLGASLLGSLALALVTPPFQVPDEAAHFFRSYRVSEGRLDLFPRAGAERATIEVSAGLLGAGGALYGEPPFRAAREISLAELRAASRIPIGEARQQAFVPNALMYTFVPYAPQALGIALAHGFGASALGVLYAGRIANLVVASALIALAVARAPAYRWLIAALALTPMAVALRGSLSPDAIVLAAAALLVSEVAARAWGTTLPGADASPASARRHVIALVAAAALLCTAKFAYLPLCLLVLLIPASRWPVRRSVALAVYALVVLAATSFAVIAARSVSAIRFDVDVNPARQVSHLLSHPIAAAATMLRDATIHAPRYASQLVGKLGWLDVPLPALLIAGYLLLLLALVAIDGSQTVIVRTWQRWFLAGVTLLCVAAVIASQYVMWTPVGVSFVEGVQGRYFLPLAVAGIWSCHSSGWVRPGRLTAAIAIPSIGIALLVAVVTVAGHYYRP